MTRGTHVIGNVRSCGREEQVLRRVCAERFSTLSARWLLLKNNYDESSDRLPRFKIVCSMVDLHSHSIHEVLLSS